MKENIGKVVLDYEKYSGDDQYSDGDIENIILDIVKNNPKDKYSQIIKEFEQWAILYHLSHIRANIIDWMPITKNDTILEIGSGCGAITGALASKSEKVTCIELSKRRSMINAYRHKNYDNICIKVGNFEDVEKTLNETYDYIMLIGVLEYAESYISDSESPFEEMLRKMKKLLKPNGKIVVAIENKFGLKYWAGCREDHAGLYFEGLEGYQNFKGVKTFTKNELINLFNNIGVSEYEFHYPYPDYKFPMQIFSDNFLPKVGDLNDNLRNYDRDRLLLFDETKVFDQIISNNMFDIYSNSFLVELKY